MDKVEKSLDSMIESLMVVWDKYSEPVADATLTLIRIEHIYYMCFGVIAIMFFSYMVRLLNKVPAKEKNDLLPAYGLAYLFSYTTIAIIFLMTVSNFRYWLAIYDPKLYLLHKVVGKVLYE